MLSEGLYVGVSGNCWRTTRDPRPSTLDPRPVALGAQRPRTGDVRTRSLATTLLDALAPVTRAGDRIPRPYPDRTRDRTRDRSCDRSCDRGETPPDPRPTA
jgi:hypothetical protein